MFKKIGLYSYPSFVILIFVAALFIRFMYFPNDVHFSFDQARDSFTSLEILKGDLKLIGPPSFLSRNLFPGPLIFYIYAPIYFFFDKNPEAASAFFRIWNSLGVFLVFLVGFLLFNRRTAIIAAIFFAFSYEQTQYALFLSHQPLAVISVLSFYLGLCLYFFRQKQYGLVIALFSLGLSMQFHYGYIFLTAALIVNFLLFRKKNINLSIQWFLISALVFIFTTFSFFLAELKYHFLSDLLFRSLFANQQQFFSGLHLNETLFIINRFLHDSFLANYAITPMLGIVLIFLIVYFYIQKSLRIKIIFLLIWFISGLSLYILSGVKSYYYSAATTVSLLLISSYFLDKLFSSGKSVLALVIILIITLSNLKLIFTINPQGLNSDMAIQPAMLTSSQKEVLDYVYRKSAGKPFAVNALTIPLNIKTTWDYLFNWYGQKIYGYTPFWIGPVASGYPGKLEVINARSKLPEKQFLIIEPTIGIGESDKQQFFQQESYFTKIVEEKSFGTITVQMRKPY